MSDDNENMVLRTLYLPLETDRQLKALAFTRDVSKGELMRELIKRGLATVAASGERSLADQLSARIAQAQPATAEKKERSAAKPAGAPRARAGATSGRRAGGKASGLTAAS